MRFVFSVLIFSFGMQVLCAQDAILDGVVVDSLSGEPLFSATIRCEDNGTTTGFDGTFSLTVSEGSTSITCSYVGYGTKEVLINSADPSTLLIRMAPTNNLLQTAVVTGSKYEQSISKSVVSIEVLKPKMLENTNTNDVGDILNKIPGVQIVDGQPNIRGGSGWSYNAGNRVMLLIDDIPALQPDAGRASWADIPVENIAQIEVVKGAGSALYGSAAMNGVINVRTGYATSEPETKVSLFATAYDDYKDNRKNWYRTGGIDRTPMEYGLSASHKQKIGKWDLIVAGFHSAQDSTRSYRDQDFRSKTRGNLNLRYRASDRVTFGVNTIVNKGMSSSFFLWENGSTGALRPFSGTVTRSDNFRFTIDPYVTIYDKKDNKHRFQGRLYYNDNNNNLNQSNQSSMLYGEYQFHRSFSEALNVTTGIVASTVDSDSELFSNADITQNNLAGFVQLDYLVNSRFKLSGGARYEYNEQSNGAINHSTIAVPAGENQEGKMIGRLGVNYELDSYTFFRASIGQAYRFPILIERFLSTEFGGFVILPNPDIQSETGVTMELGLKKGFQIGKFNGFLDFAIYNSEYNDMMEFVFVSTPIFGFQSQNIGDTRIQGFEFTIGANTKIGSLPVNLLGGYNYSNPKYRDYESISDFVAETSSLNENILKYRNKHSYTFDIQSNYKKLMFGFAFQGASHVLAIDKILQTFIPDLGSYRNFDNNGYQIFDARVGYAFDHFSLSAHLKNIFNQEYTLRPGIIEAPRNFSLRLDYTL